MRWLALATAALVVLLYVRLTSPAMDGPRADDEASAPERAAVRPVTGISAAPGYRSADTGVGREVVRPDSATGPTEAQRETCRAMTAHLRALTSRGDRHARSALADPALTRRMDDLCAREVIPDPLVQCVLATTSDDRIDGCGPAFPPAPPSDEVTLDAIHRAGRRLGLVMPPLADPLEDQDDGVAR